MDYLCIKDRRAICRALNAQCPEGQTDPEKCAAVFADACAKAFSGWDYLERNA